MPRGTARFGALAPALLSQQAVHRFVGYLHAQRERLLGRGRQGRVPNRPELVARYGYDVKYASYACAWPTRAWRSPATAGSACLPMPAAERERVLRVKRGDVPDMSNVLAEIDAVRARIEDLLAGGRSPLPAEPDWAAISAWSVRAHRQHWNWT